VETTTTMGCVTARSSARIFNAAASPVGTLWMWTLAYGYHEGRPPTDGYEPSCDGGLR
jgi:hypothetical protein